MAKIALIIASLAVGLNCNFVVAETILSRAFTSCGYVGRQIYCCGGDTSSDPFSGTVIDTNIYSLNISQFAGTATDSMSNQWNKIIPAVPFDIEPRRTPASIVLSDGKRFLIQGGHNMRGVKFSNQSIIYDATSNNWSKATSYVAGNIGTRQIYYSTAVNMPNDLIGFYGGLEQLANIAFPEVTSTGQTMPFDSNNGSFVGFSNLTTLTSGSNIWSVFSPQSNPPANFYPNSQTATFNPSTGKIYYLGGSYYTPSGGPTRASLSWSIVFDSKLGSWLNETLTGIIPTDRIYHTANLLPNSQDIIVYGGSDDGQKASTDYCFTLDLTNNQWTKQDKINVPSYLSGPRYTHSAVLVDSTLFILFGRGLDGSLSPSLLTIDVTSVSNITYSANYNPPVINIPIDNSTSNATEPNKEENEIINGSGGLSKGAIGGIAAGCVVAGLAIIACIFFYIRRQKKAKRNSENVHESLDVDWDKIDNHYKEVSINVSSSPQLTNSSASPASSPAGYSNHSPNSVAHQLESNVMVPQQLNTTPDVAVNTIKPSADITSSYSVVKPHGN